MNSIYIVFVRSNTKAGKVIRKLTGWKYSHVSISLDDNLDEFYAFSRLNYQSSLIAGFTLEEKSNYTLLKDIPAEITVYKIPISKKEYNNIRKFIDEINVDKEYIFNYPSMFTTTILHGFEIYKSYNCITFVSKILSLIQNINLNKKYYKYDLNELEQEVIDYYFKTEKFTITENETNNKFFEKISFFKRKKEELKILFECFYRLIFKKSSKKYNKNKYNEKIKKQSKKTFNILAKSYDKSLSGHNPRKNYKTIIEKIELNKNETLIDVGCGTGEILKVLSKRYPNCKLYGLDISENMIEIAKTKTSSKYLSYLVGDSENIPFKDNSFDYIITSESFHHYPNPNKVMSEFRRILKPKGKLILCDMYRPLIIRHFMNFVFHFTHTGDVKMYNKKEIFNFMNNNNFKIKNYEKRYSSFICEAINEKN